MTDRDIALLDAIDSTAFNVVHEDGSITHHKPDNDGAEHLRVQSILHRMAERRRMARAVESAIADDSQDFGEN